MNARVRAFALLLASTSLATVLVSTSAKPALAQDDPAITAEARKRFLEGVKLFDEKKYELARASFVQAYALKKHPDVLLNLAQAELLSGAHALDAAGHFRDFLRDPQTASHPRRGDAEKGLQEARAKIGRVQVTVDVSDAEVFVDGKKIGMSPLADPLDVAPGAHSVEAKKNGKSASAQVTAPEGKITIASVTLEAGTPPIVAPIPKDEPSAKDEPKPKDEPKRPKDEPKQASDEPPPEADQTGGKESFMHWAKRSPVAYIGAGLFGVGLGVGIVLGVQAKSASDAATKLTGDIKAAAARDGKSTDGICSAPPTDKYATACNNLRTDLDQNKTDKTFSTVGFVVAGVGVATIVGGYFLTRRSGDENARRDAKPSSIGFSFAPVVSPGFAGAAASGSFLKSPGSFRR